MFDGSSHFVLYQPDKGGEWLLPFLCKLVPRRCMYKKEYEKKVAPGEKPEKYKRNGRCQLPQLFLWGKTCSQPDIYKIDQLERRNWRQSSFCSWPQRNTLPTTQQNEKPQQWTCHVVASRKWWYCYWLVWLLRFIGSHTDVSLLRFFQQDTEYQELYHQPPLLQHCWDHIAASVCLSGPRGQGTGFHTYTCWLPRGGSSLKPHSLSLPVCSTAIAHYSCDPNGCFY